MESHHFKQKKTFSRFIRPRFPFARRQNSAALPSPQPQNYTESNNNNNNNNSFNSSSYDLRRFRLYSILHVRKGFWHLPGWARWLHILFLLVLALSILNLCLASVPSLVSIPMNMQIFFAIDLICCSVFCVEFCLTVWAAPSLRTLFTTIHLIDFLSFFPFFIECIYTMARNQSADFSTVANVMEDTTFFSFFRVLRIFRLFRIIRFFQMSARFRLMAKALRNSIAGIFVLLLMISFMIVFFASMVYFTEISGMNYVNGVWLYPDGNRSSYQSIPDCFWVVVLTLTTLGFSGDPPRTLPARIVLTVGMISSIFLVAFPVTMITIQYQQAVRYFGLKQRRKKTEREYLVNAGRRIARPGGGSFGAASSMMTPLHENVLRKRSDGTLAAEDIDGANEADYQQYLVQRQQHQQQQGGVLLENDESAYIVDMMSDADDIPLRQRHLPSLLAAGLPIERSDTNWSSTSGLGIEYWSTNNPTASMHAATAAGASGVGGGSPTMTAPSSPYISGYTNNNNVAPLSVAANLNPALQSPQQQPQYQPSPLSHVRHVATTSSSSPTPLHHYPFTASPGRMSPASSSSSSSAAAVAANEGDCDAVKMELEEEKQQLPPHLPPNGTLHKQSESNSSPSSVSIYRDSGGTAGVERKCADCAERDEEDEAIICSHITSDSSCIIATTTSSPINVPGKDRRGVGVVGSGSAANVDVTACDTDDNDASVLGNLSPFSLKIPIMKRMGGSIAKLKRPTLLKALTMPNNHPVGGGGGSGSKLSASSIVRLGGSPGYLSPAIASANNASPSSDAMSASYPPPDHSITNSSSNTPYYKIQKIGSNNINNNNNEVVNASTYRSMDNYLGSNNKLTRASPYSANPASTNMTSCPDLRSSPSSDPSSALALARLGTTASSTLAGSSSNIINGAGSSTTARYPIPIHRNNNNKRRSKTDYDEDDIISSGFTLPANSQMLTVSRRGDITGGTSLHPSGIDVFEMEREMDLGLQGRWPERVVLRVRKWWLTSQQVSVNDGTGGGGGTSAGKNMLERLFDPQSGGSGGGSGNAASAVALLSHPRPSMDSDHAIPHHQDVLVMELDLRNEDEFRRFVGTVATF